MKALVALIACAVMVIATLVYIRRPHDREYDWSEPEDGVQPFDVWPTTFHPEGAWIGGRYYPQDDGGTMTLSWKNDGTFTATGGHAVTPIGWKDPVELDVPVRSARVERQRDDPLVDVHVGHLVGDDVAILEYRNGWGTE